MLPLMMQFDMFPPNYIYQSTDSGIEITWQHNISFL